jgi:hypothetical protein
MFDDNKLITEEQLRDEFAELFSRGMLAARRSDKMKAVFVEVMASSLGKGIAIMCEGNSKVMSDFLEGAIHYAEEAAAGTQGIAQAIGAAMKQSRSDGPAI